MAVRVAANNAVAFGYIERIAIPGGRDASCHLDRRHIVDLKCRVGILNIIVVDLGQLLGVGRSCGSYFHV